MKMRSNALKCLLFLLCPTMLAAQQPSTNQVLKLNGTGSYVSIPSSPALQNPTAVTVEFWVYPRVSPGSSFGSFLNKGDGLTHLSARTIEGRWYPQGNGRGAFELAYFLDHVDGAPDAAALSVGVPAETWTHIAATLDSTLGLIRLYTNGLLASEATTLAGTPLMGRTLRQSGLPLVLGWTPSFNNTLASGYLDDVRVWNKARHPTEILRDFHRKLSGDETNLVGYWTFDDGTASDSTGNDLDGALFGGATTEANTTNTTIQISRAVEIRLQTGYPTTAYQLQYVTEVGMTNWTNLGVPIYGNGQMQSLFDSTAGSAKKFYRVLAY